MTILKTIALDGFRNLSGFSVGAHPRLNIFIGRNGQGKTNLLEAIHLAGSLRPLRKIERNQDLIAFGNEGSSIRSVFDHCGPLPVDIQIHSRGRQARIAGKRVRDILELSRDISVVAFTPEDLSMVRGSPGTRRRALDGFAFSVEPGFAPIARKYDRLLERRNKLLKEKWVDPQVLDAYTEPLIESGAHLTLARERMTQMWREPYREAIAGITDQHLKADLGYFSTIANLDVITENAATSSLEEMAERFRERLKETREKERVRRVTMVGPHLDDLIFYSGEQRARHFASQGEARAMVLALRLSHVRIVAKARGTPPLLLLDDVAGELDPQRAEALFALIDEVNAQTFVTATHLDALPAPGDCLIYQLAAGQLTLLGQETVPSQINEDEQVYESH